MSICTASKKLAMGLHELCIYSGLRSCNIKESLGTAYFGERKVQSHAYTFDIIKPKGPSPRYFLATDIARIGARNRGGNPRIQHDYFGFAEILSIKPAGKAKVYDLVLEKHHNFIANGMVVHNSSGEMQALYDYITDLHGVVLVFQPTDMAAADLLRTFDFLKFKKVPVLGLIANMAYCVSPRGEIFWPFLSPEVDLEKICKEFGVPLLGKIPLTANKTEVHSE